jgi:hypothetical protein
MRILSVDEEYSARAGIVEKGLPESIRRLNSKVLVMPMCTLKRRMQGALTERNLLLRIDNKSIKEGREPYEINDLLPIG